MTNSLVSIMASGWGYAIIFGVLLVEGTGMPGIPLELVFLAAGYLIGLDKMSFFWALLAATSGGVGGNLIGYALGARGGPLFLRLLKKYFRLREDQLENVRDWFSRYGGLTVFISRWFGLIRTPTIISSGMMGLDLRIYAFFSFLGSFSWNLVYLTLAWQFGQVITSLAKNQRLIGWLGLFSVILAFFLLRWWYLRRARRLPES
ncbi:MAG: DedA family protein [Firmicutes bacterium]|nr:DedA family protein [Bacillota bacterium]MCL5040622.1 DedA family protein [Bacillota bacterium]